MIGGLMFTLSVFFSFFDFTYFAWKIILKGSRCTSITTVSVSVTLNMRRAWTGAGAVGKRRTGGIRRKRAITNLLPDTRPTYTISTND
jgi:hypothetical protein